MRKLLISIAFLASLACDGTPEPLELAADADDLAAIGEPCEQKCDCSDGLECIAGSCGPCVRGQLGCGCDATELCDDGLQCVFSPTGATVCALPAPSYGEPCDHGLPIEKDGEPSADLACVVPCLPGEDTDCGTWLVCSPYTLDRWGFCGYPG